MAIDVRPVTDPEFDAWSDALDVGFHGPGNRGQGDLRRLVFGDDLVAGRIIGAFDGANVVGTLSHFAMPLAVPGGSIDTSAVSTVTVTSTHRRRGVLTRMMALATAQAVERGEAASILIPAEWPIYGRYGYGPATEQVMLRIDAREAQLIRPLPYTVELVDAEQYVTQMPAVYDRIREAVPGSILRTPTRWRRDSGLLTRDDKPTDKERLFAVVRDEAGVARAFGSYTFEDRPFENFRPAGKLNGTVVAETDEARLRLLQFYWEQDWVTEVDVEKQPIEDSYRQLLRNGRSIWQQERCDVLWVRLLDVAKALSERTYENPGRLVIAVEDKDSYATGVYALEGGPDGATCVRTTERPDLTMPVQTLGSLFLGGYAASTLAGLGLAAEETPGALRTADRMFKTARAPFCLTWF